MRQFQTCNQQLPPDALLLHKSLTIFSSKSYIFPSSATPKIPGQKRSNRASGSQVHAYKDSPHQPSAPVSWHWSYYLLTSGNGSSSIFAGRSRNIFSAQTQSRYIRWNDKILSAIKQQYFPQITILWVILCMKRNLLFGWFLEVRKK